ncbi:tyrosine-type recombinase/integrase [Actinopolymorpha alba]|uniref:tyrosine-type recombinase/integrase n=1 Tax=Actinopolymorpha alba TaxID=533267 RepID=UPI000475CD70|nr:tyrosine-type recombinase/integrase [Actinopolymorpha alba]
MELGPVKTDGSERAVALPEACCAALKRHQELQANERESAGQAWRDHDLVFATKIGTPIDPRNINRHFEELCTAAGVRRIRFHDLRHSCATLLYEQGVPIDDIQDALGHSSPTITKLIYIEVTERVQRGAVDRLD